MPDNPMPVEAAIVGEAAKALQRALKLEAFLDDFKPEDMSRLFARSRLLLCPKETRLIVQGDAGMDIFLVHLGAVSITKTFGSAGAEVAVLGPGDLFGEISFLKGGERTASATCAQESQVFRLDSRDMQELVNGCERFEKYLEKLVSSRA